MNCMIPSFKLPFTFDPIKLKADLIALASATWIAHFNTSNYSGNWDGIALRSPGGTVESIYPDPASTKEYQDTILMQACPTVREVIGSLGCEVLSARFLRMKPGTAIKTHRDHTLSFEDGEVRLHVPVITNKAVEFISDGIVLEMNEGDCWYVNAGLPHSVANRGTTDRVHLVLDCAVNDWLRSFFPKVTEPTTLGMESVRTEKDRANMIAALHEMGTAAALQIVRQLQEEHD